MTKTKIILQQDIPNLGVTGDVMDVSPGYARNYLLPRRMATVATARTLAKWDDQKKQLVKENQGKLAAAQEQSKKITDLVIGIQARAGEDGKLFGSVTTAEGARVLAEKGFP